MLEKPNNKIESVAGPNPHERRGHPRYTFSANVEAVELNSRTRIQGRASDLSRGGCYVDTIASFPAGSVVKMRITKEMRSFEADAEVVYSLFGMGMGVKFTDLDPMQLEIMEKWVGEASGKLLLEQELPQTSDQPCAREKTGHEEHDVLFELITELKRQRVVSSAKCEAMLHILKSKSQDEVYSS